MLLIAFEKWRTAGHAKCYQKIMQLHGFEKQITQVAIKIWEIGWCLFNVFPLINIVHSKDQIYIFSLNKLWFAKMGTSRGSINYLSTKTLI